MEAAPSQVALAPVALRDLAGLPRHPLKTKSPAHIVCAGLSDVYKAVGTRL
jgi:hypothetical protein